MLHENTDRDLELNRKKLDALIIDNDRLVGFIKTLNAENVRVHEEIQRLKDQKDALDRRSGCN